MPPRTTVDGAARREGSRRPHVGGCGRAATTKRASKAGGTTRARRTASTASCASHPTAHVRPPQQPHSAAALPSSCTASSYPRWAGHATMRRGASERRSSQCRATTCAYRTRWLVQRASTTAATAYSCNRAACAKRHPLIRRASSAHARAASAPQRRRFRRPRLRLPGPTRRAAGGRFSLPIWATCASSPRRRRAGTHDTPPPAAAWVRTAAW